jgi:hypothetical protein
MYRRQGEVRAHFGVVQQVSLDIQYRGKVRAQYFGGLPGHQVQCLCLIVTTSIWVGMCVASTNVNINKRRGWPHHSDIDVGRSGREDDRRTPGFGDPRRLALHGQKPYEDSRITAHSHAKLDRPAQGVGRARQSTRTALADNK